MNLSTYFVFFGKTAPEFVLGKNNITEFLGEEYDGEMVEGSEEIWNMKLKLLLY